MKNPLKGYDATRPLKDNLAQVKNFAELVIALVFASLIQGTEGYLVELMGGELAGQIIILVNMVETGVIYYVLSGIEYALKDKSEL